jgi:hypothetical protein
MLSMWVDHLPGMWGMWLWLCRLVKIRKYAQPIAATERGPGWRETQEKIGVSRCQFIFPLGTDKLAEFL